jgi:hypothetical protein
MVKMGRELNYRYIDALIRVISAVFLFLVVISIPLYRIWDRAHYLIYFGMGLMLATYILYQSFLRRKVRSWRINRWFRFNIQWMPLNDTWVLAWALILMMLVLSFYFGYLGAYQMIISCDIMILIGILILLYNWYNRKLARRYRYRAYLILLNEGGIAERLRNEFEHYRIGKPRPFILIPTHKVGECDLRILYSLITIFIVVGGPEEVAKDNIEKISRIAGIKQ